MISRFIRIWLVLQENPLCILSVFSVAFTLDLFPEEGGRPKRGYRRCGIVGPQNWRGRGSSNSWTISLLRHLSIYQFCYIDSPKLTSMSSRLWIPRNVASGDATVLEIAKSSLLTDTKKLRFNANPKSSSNIIYYLRVTIRAKNLL